METTENAGSTKKKTVKFSLTMVMDSKVKHPKRPGSSYLVMYDEPPSKKAKVVDQNWKLPRKPLPPYCKHFLAKWVKYSQLHPSMSFTELSTYLAKVYDGLPLIKKQMFQNNYERKNEIYKQQIEKLKDEHPEMFNSDGNQLTGISDGPRAESDLKIAPPTKPKTAMQLFIESIIELNNLEMTEKIEYEEECQQMWSGLSNSKRAQWIRKAISNEQKYMAAVQQLCLDNPEFYLENVKSVISEDEKKLIDELERKSVPIKPRNIGFRLYTKEMLKKLKNIPNKKKMEEILRRWRKLSDNKRIWYKQEALNDVKKHHNGCANGSTSNLKDAVCHLEKEKNIEKEDSAALETVSMTNKPVAEFKDDNDSSDKSKKQFSTLDEICADKSEPELFRLIPNEYDNTSDKKKIRRKMIEDARNQRATPSTVSSSSVLSKQMKTLKAEPLNLPQSGYLLESTENIAKLVNLVDMELNQRIVEISSRWTELSAPEQEEHHNRAAEHLNMFKLNVTKFITNLNNEDQEIYKQMKDKTKVAKKKNAKVKVVNDDNVYYKQDKSKLDDSDDID
ncbi:hypothetical protein CHUAL_010742 [Chamberlinius hualienensis]